MAIRGNKMIRQFAVLAIVCGVGAPAVAQPALPPEVQEMVDKVHLGVENNRLAAVETLPEVLERKGGDLLHKPSGFLCQHSAQSLSGFFPGFVTIFDDPKIANDFGCGMLARDVNMTVFVFKRSTDLATTLQDEAGAARNDSPPAARQDASLLPPMDGGSLGIPAGTPFTADAWIDTSGATQAVYLARFGDWYTHVRITMNPAETATGVAQAKRIMALASETIRR
jgi:hypothetical protein